MAILRIKDENGNFIEIPAIKGTDGKDGIDGKDGTNGINGTNGKDGKSVEAIKANSETEAITLSQQNPNNIYYWSD